MAEKQAPQQTSTTSKKRKKKLPVAKTVKVVLVLGLVFFGAYYFVQYNKVSDKYAEAILTTEQKNQQIIDEVAKLMELPTDEKPTVYIVSDKKKLADTRAAKEFFEKAQNNDVVLAYQKADIAVIFRPSENRIVKSDNYQSFIAASTPIKVAIVAPADKQQELATQLEGKFANVQIISKKTPTILNGANYVADLSGTNAKTAQDLAAQIGFTVSALPEGEPKPEGAIFAIVVAQ
jgi:hypothetical protein